MSISCAAHRPIRALIDPIVTAADALSVLTNALSRPARHETVALLLDDQSCGIMLFVVAGTVEPDSIHDVIDVVAEAGHCADEVSGVVVATVRPGAGVEPGDAGRWDDATDVLADRGVELVEWFVLGVSIGCPRELSGDVPRWPP